MAAPHSASSMAAPRDCCVFSARVRSSRYKDDGGGGGYSSAVDPTAAAGAAGAGAGSGDSGGGGWRSTNAQSTGPAHAAGGDDDYANEPPLLEGAPMIAASRRSVDKQLPAARRSRTRGQSHPYPQKDRNRLEKCLPAWPPDRQRDLGRRRYGRAASLLSRARRGAVAGMCLHRLSPRASTLSASASSFFSGLVLQLYS